MRGLNASFVVRSAARQDAGDANESEATDLEIDPARRSAERLNRRRLVGVAALVGVLAAGYAAYGIWINPLRPHVTAPGGYYGFSDQAAYLRTARVLAAGRLPVGPANYSFGLGYPVLGALFIKIGFRGDPFAPVDVLAFGGICGTTFVLAVQSWRVAFGKCNHAAGLVAVGILAFATPLFRLVTTPWNSTVVVLLTIVVLLLVTAEHAVTWARGLTIGVLLGWIFAARYGDAFFAALPVTAVFFVRPRNERLRLAVGGGIGLLAVVAFVAYTQYHAFGNAFWTPYRFHYRLKQHLGDDQSLNNYRLGWIPAHFFSEFISGRNNGVPVLERPMLAQFPLLPLMPIGAAVLVRRAREARSVWIAATTAFVLSSLFYLAFVAGGAGDLVFGNLRYWAIWYPLWAVLAIIGGAVVLQWLHEMIERTRRFDR
jgi:hypothetical protein